MVDQQISAGKLCDAEKSIVLFIDLQERLIPAMEGTKGTSIVNNSSRLLQAAGMLSIPVLFTEQYPKGLGHTHPTLLEARPPSSRVIEKTTFSSCANEDFMHYLDLIARPEIIVCGMETHVCVMQTTLDLLSKGFHVTVVEDAVCSRVDSHNRNGLRRMQAAGAQISNRESVMFEWLRDSDHPKFREISKKLIA